jgi:hypothetical protein
MNVTGLLLLYATAATAQSAQEFSVDFRTGQALPPALKLFGPNPARFVKQEAGGLRVTFPANRPGKQPVGLSPRFAVGGDFEITLRYEILVAQQPETGYGVGTNIYLVVGKPLVEAAGLARYEHPKKGSVYVINRTWVAHQDKVRQHIKTVPTQVKTGQLRLKRSGAILHYLVADGPSSTFRELHQAKFSPDDLQTVRFTANTGGARAALDVRFLELTIRGAHLPNEAVPPKRSWGWVVWLLLSGGVVAVTGTTVVMGWLWWRRKAPNRLRTSPRRPEKPRP